MEFITFNEFIYLQVSGEYAMLYHASKAKAIDLSNVLMEVLTSMRRAGKQFFFHISDVLIYILFIIHHITTGVGGRTFVISVLHECIWNVPSVSFVLPGFDDTDSLGYPICQVVYPSGSTQVDCFLFPCRK